MTGQWCSGGGSRRRAGDDEGNKLATVYLPRRQGVRGTRYVDGVYPLSQQDIRPRWTGVQLPDPGRHLLTTPASAEPSRSYLVAGNGTMSLMGGRGRPSRALRSRVKSGADLHPASSVFPAGVTLTPAQLAVPLSQSGARMQRGRSSRSSRPSSSGRTISSATSPALPRTSRRRSRTPASASARRSSAPSRSRELTGVGLQYRAEIVEQALSVRHGAA